ncbi:MAG: ribosomal RNA small subunit methyltransferase A [Bacteroidetes bacterium]|nr:ribosomal RNA small subunit methyltransferase A [Bacteroidota bacterium]
MQKVAPKKQLGQHFLTDPAIALKIASSIPQGSWDRVVEVGPGMGILTKPLLEVHENALHCVEIDTESVQWLEKQNWAKSLNIIRGDFLAIPENDLFGAGNVAVIGNYPYNISTQIAFRVLEAKNPVKFFGGMFQREVARRFCAEHGNKEYGVTSVLLQAFYDCKYLFTVNEGSFNPPPAVKSGVMACVRKEKLPECSYKSLALVVKTAFNQRRKTLSNALKPLTSSKPAFELPEELKGKRAEQLPVETFIMLAAQWDSLSI